MSKVTIFTQEGRVVVENCDGDLRHMGGYEFLIHFSKIVEFLRLDIEVVEVDEPE